MEQIALVRFLFNRYVLCITAKMKATMQKAS